MSDATYKEQMKKISMEKTTDKSVLPDLKGLGETKQIADQKRDARQSIKGIIVLAFAFSLLFGAYSGLSNLQSSLHRDQGMGVITQACTYGAMIFSSFFFPNFAIEHLGHRKTLTLCFIGYMTWMVANGYAVWATMVPTSIIVGLSAGPLWTAQASYIRISAYRYAKATGGLERINSLVVTFFAIWGFIFSFENVLGALLNYFVLRPKQTNGTEKANTDISNCGVNDCPWNNQNNTNLALPPSTMVWTLVGIYLGLSVAAVLLLFFMLEDLDEARITGRPSVKESSKVLVKQCFRQMVDPYQLLWAPMMAFAGLRLVLVNAEWNNSFVACTLGIYMIGLLELPNAILRPPLEILPGIVVKYVGRVCIILTANGVMVALMVFLLVWSPNPDNVWVYVLITVLFQIANTLRSAPDKGVQVAFAPRTADMAFAASLFVSTLFSTIGFAISNFLCTKVKLILGLVLVVLATASYITLELLLRSGWRMHPETLTMTDEEEISVSFEKEKKEDVWEKKWEKQESNGVNGGFQYNTRF